MKTTANIAGMKPDISGVLKLQSGNIQLTTKDFLAGSLCFKSGTSESGEFTVGAAIIGGLDFVLMNDSGKFTGLDWFDSKVSITLTVAGTSVDMNEYYIVKHYERGNVVSVECHDALKVLDEYQIYEDNLTYPADAASIIRIIAANRGLSVDGLVDGITVQDPKDDMMTERGCISYLAQCMGKYVKAEGSVLHFRWYDMASKHNAGTTFSHDLRTDDVTITGVKVEDYKNTVTETRGTAGYVVNIGDNPFIDANNIAAIADLINSAVTGIRFRPGDIAIVSNPAIEAGDVLTVATGQEQGITVIATTVTYKTSTLQQSITAEAEPYAGDLRIKRSAYVKKQAQQAVDKSMEDYATKDYVDKALAGAGGGGNTVTILLERAFYTDTTTATIIKLDGAGSISSLNVKNPIYSLDAQAITIPTYEAANGGLMLYDNNMDFVVPIAVSIGTSYFGTVSIRVKWANDHTLQFSTTTGGKSYTSFIERRSSGLIMIVPFTLKEGVQYYDINKKLWGNTAS